MICQLVKHGINFIAIFNPKIMWSLPTLYVFTFKKKFQDLKINRRELAIGPNTLEKIDACFI
jgi:hypothetical protein